MLDGWRKEDPVTEKKPPVEADVPEFLAEMGRQAHAALLQQAIGDLNEVGDLNEEEVTMDSINERRQLRVDKGIPSQHHPTSSN